MTARPSLDSSWAKLRRAERHYTQLREQIEIFEATHDYGIAVDVDAISGKYVFHVHGLKPQDPEWSLIVGDCVHNARCSLDHLVAQLVSIKTGIESRELPDVAFPIYSESGAYKGALANQLKDVLTGYQARITELQPFNSWDPSIWGADIGKTPSPLAMALGQLSDLDNIDKHRSIHATWHRIEFAAAPLPKFPDGFKFLGSNTSMSPLQDGAEIGAWTFEAPLPSTEWRPSEIDVKRAFSIRVCLTEPAVGYSVTHYLARHLWAVRAVLTIFQPVFTEGKPPLPVTAILPE
jgi:hypothetical protein